MTTDERVRYRHSQVKIENRWGLIRTINLIELQPPILDPDEADWKFFEALKGQPTIVDPSKLESVPAQWVRFFGQMSENNLDFVLVRSKPLMLMVSALGQGPYVRTFRDVDAAAEWWWCE